MVHHPVSMSLGQCSAIPFALISALVIPFAWVAPATAITYDYGRCAADLLDVGLAAESVAQACAEALHPEQVSSCVLDIATVTELGAEAALTACSRDRRPEELATCVISIHDVLDVANSGDVLGNCHRSILPVRYSDCVIDVATTAEIATTESMALCLAAGYRPVDVAPTFIYAR
jgi:hypothetical protein